MAKPGPAATPTKIVELFGNPGKRKRGAEPQPAAASIAPPADLTPLARQFWNAQAPEVARLGMLTINDVPTFAMLCESWAAYQQAKRAMQSRSTGPKATNIAVTTTDRAHGNEKRKHPAWQIFRESAALYHSLAKDFGFSPSARVGIPAAPVSDDDEDLFGD